MPTDKRRRFSTLPRRVGDAAGKETLERHEWGLRRLAPAPECHNLGDDRERDLLGADGAEVEPGWRA